MRLLLDTHVFLWYITGDQRLPHNFQKSIEECETAYLSVVSIWESIIKYQLGKLPLPAPPHPWLVRERQRHGITSLSLDEAAMARLSDLPAHHRDPFDRILICQSIEHDLYIVTVDQMLASYPAKLLVAE